MSNAVSGWDRRQFLQRTGGAVLASGCTGVGRWAGVGAEPRAVPDAVVAYPGPWAFQLPKGSIILVSEEQLEALQDPDREVDLSLSSTPNRTTLRRLCERERDRGVRTLILAFDQFFSQYRPGQGEKPRALMPDTDEYIERVARLSKTLEAHGLGLELSVLSPLELGPGYARRTGEHGRWVQYREGLRDPSTGRYEIQLWEHQRWTNNKGSIDVKRLEVRAYAFREQPVAGLPLHVVEPGGIVRLGDPTEMVEWEGLVFRGGTSFAARRLTIRGQGDTGAGPLDRVLVVVSYRTPEMDYFSPQALPFLKDLVDRYHRAGVPLHGLYADEMHIQQDWVYHTHHDEGQFTLRYVTPGLARAFAAAYGDEYGEFEKYLVYFCYAQHGFLPGLEARRAAQHVLGASAEDIQRTCLLRRRYYDLLSRTVVGLFAEAKRHAEERYGRELEARAHATWAQSPTIDCWDTGGSAHAPRQYEYTPNFEWSNTVQQAASACDDYFRWNDFLTGGGNDHAEGGWSDRNYYALALACSTGILNRTPYAYAAHWGMPAGASERRQALVDAYGAAARPAFQAIEDCEHRDIEVLMLYPLSLVACEERFGSWMVQYGYANYVTAEVLIARGRVLEGGAIEMAGRRFTTLVALFEPLPPRGLLTWLEEFVRKGGRLIWAGPPPRLDLGGGDVLASWQGLFGLKEVKVRQQGRMAPGETVLFDGRLKPVPPQTILTHFLVDLVYPVEPGPETEVVARLGSEVVGAHRGYAGGGTATFLGFRPRDDQAASLGSEVRTWFEVLHALGAYPGSGTDAAAGDNPSVVSRQSPYVSCRFPNGTVTVAAHYRSHVESWPGGFHRDAARDAETLKANPLPPDALDLERFRVAGREINYHGRLLVAFRMSPEGRLVGFGGYNCSGIRVDGTEHRFSEGPVAHLAWAPVAPKRQVKNGARVEIWASGDSPIRIPIPTEVQGRLYLAGARPGMVGKEVQCSVAGGYLEFTPLGGGGVRHLYLL